MLNIGIQKCPQYIAPPLRFPLFLNGFPCQVGRDIHIASACWFELRVLRMENILEHVAGWVSVHIAFGLTSCIVFLNDLV